MKNQRTDAFLFETTTQDHHQQKKNHVQKHLKKINDLFYICPMILVFSFSSNIQNFFFFVASYNKCIENTLHELSLTHFPNNSWFSR